MSLFRKGTRSSRRPQGEDRILWWLLTAPRWVTEIVFWSYILLHLVTALILIYCLFRFAVEWQQVRQLVH